MFGTRQKRGYALQRHHGQAAHSKRQIERKERHADGTQGHQTNLHMSARQRFAQQRPGGNAD